MTGGTELDVVTIDGLTKVTSDTVMTWREELYLDVVTIDGLTKVTSDTVMTWRDELS